VKRAPQFLASAVEDRETVGIVDRRAEIIDIDPVVGPEEEHARHRR
jgi:hypothetical protein